MVKEDLAELRAGNVMPTSGDTRCLAYGHLIRLAIWSLRFGWQKDEPIAKRIASVAEWLHYFGGWNEVQKCLERDETMVKDEPMLCVHERAETCGGDNADLSF